MSTQMENGFLFACLLDGKGGADLCSQEELELQRQDSALLWVHLDYSEPASVSWLRETSGVSELVADILTSEETRPRFLEMDDIIVLILREINTNEGQDIDDMISLRLYVSESLIISCRKRQLNCELDLTLQLEKNRGPKNSGEFIVFLTESIVGHMGEGILEIEEKVGAIEERVSDGVGDRVRAELSDLRRTMIRLRRYLSPQREAISKLVTSNCELLTEKDVHRLREVNDDSIRYLETLDSARDQALVTHEELSQKLSEVAGKRVYLLTIVAAVFLPLSFITGLLGINVAGIPNAENPGAFLYVSGGLGIVLAIELLLFRFLRWY